MRQKILLIEDDNASRPGIVRSLSRKGYAVSVANDLVSAEADLLARRFDAVILGINLADGKGPGFIRGIRRYHPTLPLIAVTDGGEIEIAVDAVRCGADNVLAKPVDSDALCLALKILLEDGSRQLPQVTGRQLDRRDEEKFFGTGPASARLLELARRAVQDGAPVLILGETGTGKGLLAKWIHQNGQRSSHPFAAVNCSGLRGDLLGMEIFGPGSGWGSDGAGSRLGLLERAQGGTLFLDEVGDMDPRVQRRLLALLQAADRQPAGDREAPGIGLQLICSSNQQLEVLARAGSFLPELLSRIGAAPLRVPPLRERLTEFPGIVRHLLSGLGGPEALICDAAMRTLKGYRWPGNLRELKNALEQALMLSHGARLQPEHFKWLKSSGRAGDQRPLLTMSELKEQHIATVLQRSGGKVNEVAITLGISRATMYRRLKQLRGKVQPY